MDWEFGDHATMVGQPSATARDVEQGHSRPVFVYRRRTCLCYFAQFQYSETDWVKCPEGRLIGSDLTRNFSLAAAMEMLPCSEALSVSAGMTIGGRSGIGVLLRSSTVPRPAHIRCIVGIQGSLSIVYAAGDIAGSCSCASCRKW